ncbi:kinase-like domain-containing protein [Sporodiniella umbellata]|nr:kinase-like domain-containing protein [Sporodiniella umbellata]
MKQQIREARTIREAYIMKLLHHPHIVQLKELHMTASFFYITMEYVEGGQLLHHIVSQGKLDEDDARSFARQIISALDYMHRNSIVHRDLKIENILLDKDRKNVKVVDFGLSNLYCPERRLSTYCGSLYFAAPELLRGEPYRGPEIDVWSLGVVIYVMVTGVVPFDDLSLSGLHNKIKSALVNYPEHLSPPCQDMLQRILVADPHRRMILADVIRHPWMCGPTPNYLPLRMPLTVPLTQLIMQRMTIGFRLGTTDEIKRKLETIISSPVYQFAAEHVARIQLANMRGLPPQSPAHWGNYDDPQTVPSAYHPLCSIYHLTRERFQQPLVVHEKKQDLPEKETLVSEVVHEQETTLRCLVDFLGQLFAKVSCQSVG